MTSMEKKSPDADAPGERRRAGRPRLRPVGRLRDRHHGEVDRRGDPRLRHQAARRRPRRAARPPRPARAVHPVHGAGAARPSRACSTWPTCSSRAPGQTIIAMGLVFVLLIGEIDLAAGTASGLTAAVMALHLVSNGNLLGAMGTTVFVLFAVGLAVTVALGVLLRIWSGAVLAARRAAPAGGRLPAEPVAGDAARGLHGRGHRDASPASSCPGSGCRRSWSPSRCSSRGRA